MAMLKALLEERGIPLQSENLRSGLYLLDYDNDGAHACYVLLGSIVFGEPSPRTSVAMIRIDLRKVMW